MEITKPRVIISTFTELPRLFEVNSHTLFGSHRTINSSEWKNFSTWSDSPLGGSSGVNGCVLHDESLLYEICMDKSAQQPDSCCSITLRVFDSMLLNLKLARHYPVNLTGNIFVFLVAAFPLLLLKETGLH